MWNKIKHLFSKCIINFFGDVQFFPMPMFCLLWGDTQYKVKGEESREILNKLKKGDIILCRFDRYVSSWFIPGFYTHVALYIGDNRVVHAVTKGVKDEDILTLLRTDYICVLRPKKVTGRNINEACQLAKGFVGRKYDFVFENETDDRLYCSELVFRAWSRIFKSTFKDDVISPDEYRDLYILDEIHESRKWRQEN